MLAKSESSRAYSNPFVFKYLFISFKTFSILYSRAYPTRISTRIGEDSNHYSSSIHIEVKLRILKIPPEMSKEKRPTNFM